MTLSPGDDASIRDHIDILIAHAHQGSDLVFAILEVPLFVWGDAGAEPLGDIGRKRLRATERKQNWSCLRGRGAWWMTLSANLMPSLMGDKSAVHAAIRSGHRRGDQIDDRSVVVIVLACKGRKHRLALLNDHFEQSSEPDGLTPLRRGAQNHALLKVAEKPRKLGASEFKDIVSCPWGANEHRNFRSQRLAGERDLRGDLARAEPNPGVEHRGELGFVRLRREIKTTKQSPQGRSRSSHRRHQRLRRCHHVVESRLARNGFRRRIEA